MNNYTPEAEQAISAAENKLADSIATLRSTEPKVEIIPDDRPDVDIEIDTPEPPKSEKAPRRSEFVETDDPKVIERINDLYGQVKKSDSRNQMILEHNRQLEERLAQAVDKLNQLDRTTRDANTSKVEQDLRMSLRIAKEEGDDDKVAEIEDKLWDLKLEKRLSNKEPAISPPPPKIQESPDDREFVEKARYIEYLAQERDSVGNPIRPYLQDWHPQNAEAIKLFQTIPQEFAAAGKTADIKTIMDVLDERIKGKPKTRQNPQVLSSDGGDAPARSTIKLTQEELYVAQRMGIKPEAYARQKALLKR